MAGTMCGSAGEYLAGMSNLLPRVDSRSIDQLVAMLFDAWHGGKRVFVFGNGGSASTASHWVCDLMKTGAVEGRPRLQISSLGDNLGLLTALGNDVSYDDIFRYPLAAQAHAGDVAVAISCSGNSPNVLRACEWAGQNGLQVVALTGLNGGKVKDLARLHINIPSDNFGLIEDLHLAIGHIAAQALCGRIKAAP